ncbi:MAG TPA: hypothetical protein PKA82_14440 [Pyrinomonadaceae bacterium]|nr:hypothetical protein [Pyrinomonadaceae bacterium]
MDYRKLSDAELVDFSRNVKTSLDGGLVTGLDPAIATDLARLLDPLNISFETAIEDSVVRDAAKKTAFADKQTLREDIKLILAKVRNNLVAAECPRRSYEACGFNYPKPPTTILAEAPTDLAAAGTSNGVTRLQFFGNNKVGTVVYEMWRRAGDDGEWGVLGVTKKQTYIDSPVTPGQFYEYKVRAVAATNTSHFSNSAVIYGAP